jgi:hypothetical protein
MIMAKRVLLIEDDTELTEAIAAEGRDGRPVQHGGRGAWSAQVQPMAPCRAVS